MLKFSKKCRPNSHLDVARLMVLNATFVTFWFLILFYWQSFQKM